jgi:hypothetical protein
MLAALYVAMDTQLRSMDAGREKVEKSAVARSLFNRISNDLTPSLAPIAATGTSSGTGSGGGGATSGAAPTTPTTSSTDTSSTSTLVFQIGVKGDSSQVAIYQTRLGRNVIVPPVDPSGNQMTSGGDISRISYFMSNDTTNKPGLARQEIRLVTADQVDDVAQDVNDGFSKIVAQEVESFELRYFDGSSWTDSWDGSTPGPDGKTPQGPPRCIEVTVGIRLGDDVKTFKHVIAFAAAPGAASDTSSSGSTTGSP